ncbi:multimerin-1 [Ambystoma mexicanum]|uniref:multimerin-1 n=1 Tax=Ambystoma mexicanum TaxID=8296 RepID=UPI0037E8BEBC
MAMLVFLVILSHGGLRGTHAAVAGSLWEEDNATETGSLSFTPSETTDAQSLQQSMGITAHREADTFNLASVGATEMHVQHLADSAAPGPAMMASDAAATDWPEGTEASTQVAIFAKSQTLALEQSPAALTTLAPEESPAALTTLAPEESPAALTTLAPAESPAALRKQAGCLPEESSIAASPPTGSTPGEDENAYSKIRNRSPRQTILSTGNLSAKQWIGTKKGSFETTRGKNWCAYVHTRLSPSVAAGNVETFISALKDPCTAKIGGCPIRYQMVTRPTYRIKHKIVTSLEWKCCPGYSGEKCQITVLRYQMQTLENQAESTNAINGGRSHDPQQSSLDAALMQKMTDRIDKQEMQLTSLQKNVVNISSAMNEVRGTVLSLEEKINEDNPGKSVQMLLKGLKSKTITELVKDIVREQMKEFQIDMQETFAQLFKTLSRLSVEVESTKEGMKHLNETVTSLSAIQNSLKEQEPRPTMGDILELKNHLVNVKEETTSFWNSSLQDLQESHKSLAAELEREQSRSNLYYESLNTTLSKMREVQDQILLEEQTQVHDVPTIDGSNEDNVTEYLLTLQEKVKRQSFMMLRLYEDISAQDTKINNFTITLELQKDSIQRACEARFSKCRKDFESKIRSTEEHVHVLNKTMSDVVLPLDDKIDKMNEQINDLCYDMEILQPLIEQGAPFSMTADYGQQNGISAVNKHMEDISAAVFSLSDSVRDLSKGQDDLRSEAQARDQEIDRRIAACVMDIEDGLNNTMTVLNNAVDFIQDNYVLKETMHSLKNDSQLLHQTVNKLDGLSGVIPQVNQLNESVTFLANSLLQNEMSLQQTKTLSEESLDLEAMFHIVNKTAAKVTQCHQNVSQIEQNLLLLAQQKGAYEYRLQNVELKMAKIIANSTLAIKPKNGGIIGKEKEQPAYPKYQELNSRVRALEAKSIRLSTSMPILNKTVHDTLGLCQNAFVSIQNVNSSLPQLIRTNHPNITILQEIMSELVKSVTDGKAESIWSNVTTYINKSTSEVISNVAKLQKQMKLVIKKTVLPKTPSPNVTSTLVGRSQRNTDNAPEQDDFMSCNTSPCHNGGTCINDRDSFVCACRHPFGGANCSIKMSDENTLAPDFSKGSYRYTPMVTFFVSHTYGMTNPGPIKFNNLYVNYGASYVPSSGKFLVPYLGVYVFKYTIESFSPRISGYLVVDGIDKLAFQSENINSSLYSDRVITGDALLELNYGQAVWLRLATGSIPAKYPPVTTFGGFLLYRT